MAKTIKLYRVKIETDIMVVADSETSAFEIAKKNAPSEVSLYGKGSAQVVRRLSEIPEDWKNIIPYSGDGLTVKKCIDYLSEAINVEKKQLPQEDMDDLLKIQKESKASGVPEVVPETRSDPKPKELDWRETKSQKPIQHLRFIREK